MLYDKKRQSTKKSYEYYVYEPNNYKICEVKTDRTKRRNRQIHNYYWRHQTPVSTIDRTISKSERM